MIQWVEKPQTDEEIFTILHPLVKRWFQEKFKTFSMPQKYGIMPIHSRENILISSPTGSGKTLTGFGAILNELVDSAEKGILEDKVYCIYVSPLKALSTDIQVNLLKPLEEIEALSDKDHRIRVGVRTGDTTAYQRQKMAENVPHILITTPESLALLLVSKKFRPHLRAVDWVLIDEIHSFAENKRGTHLSLLLEQLQVLNPGMARIGLSATVAPLEKIAQFLAGTNRTCKLVDISYLKELDMQVLSPVTDLINTDFKDIQDRTYELLHELIQSHKTTLIFTNTRAGTERVVHTLKQRFPGAYYEIEEKPPFSHASLIGAHHGSLSKLHRFDIEQKLRDGKLKAVVCSTSLELGIDIGSIDLVILLGSPKSVARALQRCLPYDAEILLADGSYKKIGEIVENKEKVEVISYDKTKGYVKNKIVQYHKNEADTEYTIQIRSENKITCTAEHPILTKEGWKKAKDITFKDQLATVCSDIRFENKEPKIYEIIPEDKFYVSQKKEFFRKITDNLIKKGYTLREISEKTDISYSRIIDLRRAVGRKKSVRLDYFLRICDLAKIQNKEKYLSNLKSRSNFRLNVPLKLNKEILWLAGIVATDGCIVKCKSKWKEPYYHIKIGNTSKVLIDKAAQIMNKLGFNCYKSLRKDGFFQVECGSSLLSHLFFSLGIPCKNKTINVEVSNNIFKLPKKLQYAYLEGIFEGDGNFGKKTEIVRIFSASPKFAKGLHNLLIRLGINSKVNKSKSKTSKLVKKINHKEIFVITISRKKEVQNFFNNIPCFGEKANNSKKLIQNKNFKYDSIKHQNNHIIWRGIENISKKKKKAITYNLTLNDPNNNFIVENIITHNCGRAGHQLHAVTKGRLIVTDRDDLIECSVLLKNALERKIDKIHIPENALDVLVQHILGFVLDTEVTTEELYNITKESYSYRNLSYEDFIEVIRYLAGDFQSLENRNIFAKIRFEDDILKSRGKLTRMIYTSNLGTIPSSGGVVVKIGENPVGMIDESFLERLKKGDTFVLGGDVYEFKFARGMVAQVSPAYNRTPTVPQWFSEMLPLNFDLAESIQNLRSRIYELLDKKTPKKEILEWIHSYVYVNDVAAEAIYTYMEEQYSFLKAFPRKSNLVVEAYHDDFLSQSKKHYLIVHSLHGRRANEALSRVFAYALGKFHHKDVEVGLNDNGFYLASTKQMDIAHVVSLIEEDEFKMLLKTSLERTEIVRRRFRQCAERAFMILRSYKGKTKRTGRQQVSSQILLRAAEKINKDFVIIKEAMREVVEDAMDIDNAAQVFSELKNGSKKLIVIETSLPSPFATNLMLQGFSDIISIEDRHTFLQKMHTLALAKIGREVQPTSKVKKVIKKQKISEKQRVVLDELKKVKSVPVEARNEIAKMIKGIEPDSFVIQELHRHKNMIRVEWPQNVADFVLAYIEPGFDAKAYWKQPDPINYENFWDMQKKRSKEKKESEAFLLRKELVIACKKRKVPYDVVEELIFSLDGKKITKKTKDFFAEEFKKGVHKAWSDRVVKYIQIILKK